MEQSDRDISQWDARLKQQLERSFHNYYKRRIDLSVARDNKQYDWTGETIIVEKASSSTVSATVRLMFEDAGELTLGENVEIKSIFNKVFISNAAQAGAWLDVIAGINFEYKKKIAEAGGDGLTWFDRGDISAYDWSAGDFTKDDAWHDLDLSAIVPPGTKCVLLRMIVRIASPPGYICFRKDGYSNEINIDRNCPSAPDLNFPFKVVVEPSTARLIEYNIKSGNYTTLNVFVSRWLV